MSEIAAAAVAMLAAGAAQALPGAVPADLARAVRDYDQAQVRGDGPELRRLLAEDYVLVNSSGKTETKAELVADYTDPGYRLDPFTVRAPIERVWRDGAVMGGVATLSGTSAGQRFSLTLRFADVWAKRAGAWQVVYTQVSRIP